MELTLVEKILGGEKVLGRKLKNKMDLFELSMTGIAKIAVSNLAEYMMLSSKQIAELLPVAESTLRRYSDQQTLNQAVSERVLRIAEVTAKGIEVFGDKANFISWLHIQQKVLSNKAPLALLGSEFGSQLVLEELGRIEYGVFS